MDIHSLTYFKQVADLQHLTRAAEQLHVAQPSLSRTISSLEERLNVRLFERTGKNIVLNEYGKIVLRHTNQILQELDDIKTEIELAKGINTQSVTLSLYAASKVLPKLVMEFKKDHPTIRLSIIQEDLSKKNEIKCDLSIYSSLRPTTQDNQVTLVEEEILLALPESSPLAQCKKIDLIDVKKMDFISLHKSKSLRNITDMYCNLAGFDANVILECDSPEIVREFIRAGLGIAFVPSISWSGMQGENIVLRPISFPICKRYINLSWREETYLSPAAILFRDYAKSYFKTLALYANKDKESETNQTQII